MEIDELINGKAHQAPANDDDKGDQDDSTIGSESKGSDAASAGKNNSWSANKSLQKFMQAGADAAGGRLKRNKKSTVTKTKAGKCSIKKMALTSPIKD